MVVLVLLLVEVFHCQVIIRIVEIQLDEILLQVAVIIPTQPMIRRRKQRMTFSWRRYDFLGQR